MGYKSQRPNSETRKKSEARVVGDCLLRSGLMRKRILIGLLAAVLIGVVAFFVSQPKQGTLKWHKREYLAAMDRWTGTSFGQRFRQISAQLFGVTLQPEIRRDLAEKVVFHRRALIEAGYLEQRAFTLTNGLPKDVATRASMAAQTVLPAETRQFVVFMCGNNQRAGPLTIICVRQDIAKWEELVRKADTP
jgi:hypothetical protein